MDRLTFTAYRRTIILFEEWLTYSLMLFCRYYLNDTLLTSIVVGIGAPALFICYYNLHKLEMSIDLYKRTNFRGLMNPIKYLLFRKIIIFLDTVLLCAILLFLGYYVRDSFVFKHICVLGGMFIGTSYFYYMKLEKSLKIYQ